MNPIDPMAEALSLRELLLGMPQVHATSELLDLVVGKLAEREHVALARIWLMRPGDICPRCPSRASCPTQVDCLHLVASAGRSRVDPEADWSRIDGAFRRFSFGHRKVGTIAEHREPLELRCIQKTPEWLARPEWAEGEGIHGFAGQPLIFREELLGVLAIFLRVDGVPGQMEWLRMIADHLAVALANARAFEEIDRLKQRLELENEYLREEVSDAADFGDIVGRSAALQAILRQIELVAPTDSTVMITGESGVGKELIAREIHCRSDRASRPMIRVNCASIPRELFESEFFGHTRGSFTGAVRDRIGRFSLADGGTIFLDEVGEIPLELQSKLLRVLQEGEFERLGEERTRTTDVRVVAATNRDLRREVDAGRFREDLFYRLNVFPIEVPPLRRRPEDIPALTAHFVGGLSAKLKREEPHVSRALLMRLQAYAWPGNVRELQNAIERGLITSTGRQLRVDLPEGGGELPSVAPVDAEVLTELQVRALEKRNIERALQQSDAKVYGPDGAAALLGIKPTTLLSRIKKLGIDKHRL